ncbi:primosomal replication protein N [Alcaligenaceae bacterium CGII-47]|nr:primosomal replication protein N [Alcaligenaceae bacterium CGII-47]
MNRFALTASLQEIKTLRYTPAGVPVIEMVLAHESDVREAGQMRRIEIAVSAVALGEMALLLIDTPLGCRLEVEGFIAAQRQGSSKLVLHIQQASRHRVPPDPLGSLE